MEPTIASSRSGSYFKTTLISCTCSVASSYIVRGVKTMTSQEGIGSAMFINSTEIEPAGNFTLTCAARSLQNQATLSSATVLTTTRVIQCVFILFLLVFGTLLNIKVIVLVAKFKRLKNLSFAIAVQISVLDLILSITLAAVTVPNAIAKRWVFGEHMCSIVGMILLSCSILRTFLMFVFVIDRFLSVFLPFFYPRYKIKSMTLVVIASWILSIAFGIIAYALDCYRFTPISWLCSSYGDCNKACGTYTNLLYGGIAAPATIIPIVLYIILYAKARRLKKASLSSSTESVVAIYHVQEWKATLTFFLLFITVFALTFPSLAVFLVIDSVYGNEEVPPALHVVAVVSVSIISLLVISDPIVIMRNRDVRDITNELKDNFIQRCCPSRS